jgi:HSP20 family protein
MIRTANLHIIIFIMNGKITVFDPNRIFSNNFVNSFFSDYPVTNSTNEIEMYEDEINVVVRVKAPGFKAENIEISTEGKILTVTGKIFETKNEDDPKRKYYYREITNETFTRSVALPTSVKSEEAKAEFKDGILSIELPKIEDVKPKRIEIKTK